MAELAGHAPITTLDEWDLIDMDEYALGYRETMRGDPEPGLNRSRSYHHGWRMRMLDLREIRTPDSHSRLVRAAMDPHLVEIVR